MEAWYCCILYSFYFICSVIASLAVMVGCGSASAVFIVGTLEEPQTKAQFSSIHSTGVLLIVITIILLLVIFCGFCGICLRLSVMLVTFICIMLLVIIAEIAAIGLTWKNTREKEILKQARNLISSWMMTSERHYNSKAAVTCLTLLGFVQTNLQCCGIDGIQDYGKHNLDAYRYLCQNPLTGTYYIPGCVPRIAEWFKRNAGLVGSIAFGTIILEIIAIILAILILIRLSKTKKDSEEDEP